MNAKRIFIPPGQWTNSAPHSPLSDGANYYWYDLTDMNHTLNKEDVKAYVLPNVNSHIDGIYDIGDPIPVYSYLIISGQLWIEFPNYITGHHNYIPVPGDPGDGDTVPKSTFNNIFDTPYGVLTVEQHQQQQNEQNANPLDGIITAIKGIGTVVLVGYLLNAVAKFKGSSK